eukprot:SAG11_NODE_204_length_12459_cov_6.526133_6_plen_103_part_00
MMTYLSFTYRPCLRCDRAASFETLLEAPAGLLISLVLAPDSSLALCCRSRSRAASQVSRVQEEKRKAPIPTEQLVMADAAAPPRTKRTVKENVFMLSSCAYM